MICVICFMGTDYALYRPKDRRLLNFCIENSKKIALYIICPVLYDMCDMFRGYICPGQLFVPDKLFVPFYMICVICFVGTGYAAGTKASKGKTAEDRDVDVREGGMQHVLDFPQCQVSSSMYADKGGGGGGYGGFLRGG